MGWRVGSLRRHSAKFLGGGGVLAPPEGERAIFMQGEGFYRYRFEFPARSVKSYLPQTGAVLIEFPTLQARPSPVPSISSTFDSKPMTVRSTPGRRCSTKTRKPSFALSSFIGSDGPLAFLERPVFHASLARKPSTSSHAIIRRRRCRVCCKPALRGLSMLSQCDLDDGPQDFSYVRASAAASGSSFSKKVA